MSALKGVLKEELVNSLRMKKIYERELIKLPKGSLVKSRRKKYKYYYLVLRENGKVRLIYKGKLSNSEVKKYKEIKESRIKYQKLLLQVKRQIKFLEKVLKNAE